MFLKLVRKVVFWSLFIFSVLLIWGGLQGCTVMSTSDAEWVYPHE